MAKKRWLAAMAAVALALVFLAAVVLGCGDESENGFQVAGDGSDGTLWEKSGMEEGSMEEPALDEIRQTQSDYASGESGTVSPPSSSTLPQLQLKVIKTALVEMETDKGDYARIREDALAVATAAGGYVEGESASQDDEGLTYATLTFRVPSDRFDEVVKDVSKLGEVISTQVSTNDVSAEYVDLESRLRHLQAEESFYLSLIGKAQTIQEMITIREHLDSIQLEKEQVQGRMSFLDQQVGYSTLTLSIDEIEPDTGEEGFWGSVGDAFRSFGRGMGKLAVGFFYALPYLVIVAVLGVVGWLLLRRSHKPPKH